MEILKNNDEYIREYLDTKIKKYNTPDRMYFEQIFIVKTNYENYFEITLPKVELNSAKAEIESFDNIDYYDTPTMRKYINRYCLINRFKRRIGHLTFKFYPDDNDELLTVKPIKGKRLEKIKEKYEKPKEEEE